MVAQFPVTPATPPKILMPGIHVTVNTFLGFNAVSLGEHVNGSTRTCNIVINVSNLNRSHAINAFERIFNYVQLLANNDLNPTSLINQDTISSTDPGDVFSPTGVCNINVDMTEIIATVKLNIQVSNLRLDYMDEYFTATLNYLSLAIANDLNPDIP
jgi:hypothetical protein